MADQDLKKVRVPPNSKESEMMVLGCMLTSVNALNIAADNLDPNDFYYTEHQIVYAALKTAYRADKPADIHLIAEELKRQDRLETIGGVSYLTTLAQYAGTSAFIEEYVTLVRDKALLRRMIDAAQRIEKSALDDPADVGVVLDEAQAQLFQISQATQRSSAITIKELISGIKAESGLPYLKELQQRQQLFQERGSDEIGITGLPTHFIDLDKMLNGFIPSNLIILGARPSMGKTALAINIAENICFKNNVPVGIFSLEMSASQLLHRMICSQSEIESGKIVAGSLSGQEYQRIVATVHSMQKHTMIIDDQPGLKITDLRARARRMKEAYNVGFIVIDYLQLLSGSGTNRSSESRQIEISEISRMLKNLAREINVPILCLAQLSRKVEERQGHRPMMSDLRESGCLTGDTLIQDAETGQIYTIKELADRKEQKPIQVLAVDQSLKLGTHTLTKAFYSGRKRVYEIKTHSGRSIKASANHPFLKLEGWTRLDQLKVDQHIAIPRSTETEPKESSLDKNELGFLAHLLGDNCILPKQPSYYTTNADSQNIQFQDFSKTLFGIHSHLVPQKNWFHAHFPSPIRLARNKHHPITTWVQQIGTERVRSYEKTIPFEVFSSKSEDRALFLHHLWAADGNISSKFITGRKPSASIYYASSSPVLANQVQRLMLSLGIQSSLRNHPSKTGYRTMSHVYVEGKPNQIRFLTKVGCAGERGKIIPSLLSDLDQIETTPNHDSIPKEAWKTFIKAAKDRANLGWKDVCKSLNSSESTLFNSDISRERMTVLADCLKDPNLANLAQSGVYWDKILSITDLGEEDTYDATVPGVHNFVANDIVVHNSLEQDADVVMFLFRREYYDKADKPGLAEVIVSKNRHGGVGDINLTFRKELAQFANYTPIQIQPPGGKSNKEAFSAFSP